MAKSPKSFEEFYFKPVAKIVPLYVLENYAKTHSGKYEKYEGNIFCPECKLPQLTLVQNYAGESHHLRKYPKQLHDEDCSYNYEHASKKAAIKFFESLSKSQIEEKLYGMQLWLEKQSRKASVQTENSTSKKTRDSNPFLFTISEKGQPTKTYKTLRRKSLNNNLSDVILGELYIFYGKVKLETEVRKSSKGNKNNFLIIKTKNSNGVWIRLITIMRWGKKDDIDPTKECTIFLIGALGSEYTDRNNGEKKINKKQIELFSSSALVIR